jgi:hypothetical protein
VLASGKNHQVIVKANQPDLCWELEHRFAHPMVVAVTWSRAVTFDQGHGRLEVRRLWFSTALIG